MSKKNLKGEIISTVMQKTVVVKTELVKMHPVYKKRYKVNNKYKAHTELKLNVGDMVIIEESRPISKTKTWVVKEVLKEVSK